jgi:putative transposase
VELLKKLDMKERLLVAKGMDLSKDKLFELIKDAIDDGLAAWLVTFAGC